MTDSNRDRALRDLLTERVRREAPRRRIRRTTILTAVVAFVIGGGVVGGALSAAAASAPHPAPVTAGPGVDLDALLRGATPVGPMLAARGPGAARIDLGPRPAGATGMAVIIRCESNGRLTLEYGGERTPPDLFCGGASTEVHTSTRTPTDSTVILTPDGSLQYTLWAEWIDVPPLPGPSAAQQAETADGVITAQEHDDAVSRYIACLTGAGFDVTLVQSDDGVETERHGAPRGGFAAAQARCMAAELGDVERLWEQQRTPAG
jgi:hypothetical protein